MGIHDALTTGPGYYLGLRLTAQELRTLHGMIAAHYLDRLEALDPALADEAAALGIENYHRIQDRLDHSSVWPKKARILPDHCVPALKQMGFYQAIEEEFRDVLLSDEDRNWRLVRPHAADDVGSVHADCWFWDLGYGSNPEGYDRFKVWIPIVTEPGANGLSILPGSHRRDWKHHAEVRHGAPKPVIDENVEELGMQLLLLEPGEMVLFHDRLLHGGVVNRGRHCRVSMELTVFFRKAGAVPLAA
jgi:ectoine hydroxylase-related dioxygenase (phytanoyl-CoA dioxygenase family)